MLLASAPVFAQETLPPPYQRDGEIYFVEKLGSRVPFPGKEGNASYACLQANSRIEYTGKNRRTVGTGLVNETVDGNGALLGADSLIANGLLAREARIRVTTYGNCSIDGRGLTAWVFINEETRACRAEEPLVFSEYPAQERRDHVLRFDAACLRYGVRQSADAATPAPMENRIIVLPDSAPVEILPVEPHFSVVEVALTGDAGWWETQLPEFLSNKETYGLEAARTWHPYGMIVEFEALAPIALVHGYTSSVEFWTKHDERGREPETALDRFTTPFDEQHVGYGRMSTKNASGKPSRNRWDKKPNIAPSTTGRVSAALLPEFRALASRFGADYVNIVSHSMGAIWSRAAIELLKASTPDENAPGVLYFVALSPMHHGSVLADLREVYAWKNIPKFFLFGETGQGGFSFWKRMATRLWGRADASLTYATTWKAAEFNREPELPEEFLVKGVKTRLGKWTLANSFNENENCNADHLDQVECGDHAKDPDECKRQRQTLWFGLDLTRAVNQARSNTLQRLQRVEIGSRPSGKLVAEFIAQPFPTEPSTTGCPQGRYPLNDLTLRTQDMFYRNFNILPGDAGRAYHIANHSMVGHSSVAEEVRLFPLRADEQSGLKEKQ